MFVSIFISSKWLFKPFYAFFDKKITLDHGGRLAGTVRVFGRMKTYL